MECVRNKNYNEINSIFNKSFSKSNRFICGRFDMEHLSILKKVKTINKLILSYSPELVLCRVLYWEEDKVMESFFRSNFPNSEYEKYKSYNGKQTPGIYFVSISNGMRASLEVLLINHFNYELAKMPSLNIRVQICIYTKSLMFFLDIYDDRGFNMHIQELSYPANS